jgi:hypothetical protein
LSESTGFYRVEEESRRLKKQHLVHFYKCASYV